MKNVSTFLKKTEKNKTINSSSHGGNGSRGEKVVLQTMNSVRSFYAHTCTRVVLGWVCRRILTGRSLFSPFAGHTSWKSYMYSTLNSLEWETKHSTYEPRHDKTSKVTVRPAKTQISQGFHPVWSESSLSAWRKLWVFSYPLSAQWRLWWDWADAQADLSLRWAHSHFVGFVMSRLIFQKSKIIIINVSAWCEYMILFFL